MRKIILASGSPRRKELLEQVGIEFEAIPADIEESSTQIVPSELVMELSRKKAEAVWKKNKGRVVLASDTVVVFGDVVLGKPKTEVEAFEMLKLLSGKEHFVYTGVCIIFEDGSINSFFDRTGVKMFESTDKQIQDYVNSGEPMDKAGAYGIQGRGAVLVEAINGDYYTVMGLPIARIYRELSKE